MHWLPRLAGLGVVLGLLGWSINFSLQQLDGQPSIDGSGESTALVERATDDEVVATSEDGSAPEYLSFMGGVPSGRYSVADLPDSRDWDYGERGGREPEPSHISPDNPVAEQLTIVDNDYVTAPGSETPISGDETDGESGDSESGDSEFKDSEFEDGASGDGEPRDSLPSIDPGMYATEFGVVDCEYELRRIMDDNRDHVIGHDRIGSGRMIVSINEVEPDTFVATRSCGEWSPWSPLVEPLTVAGTGDYWIGDLAQGVWSVPSGCFWEKVVSFRGALLIDVEDTGAGPGELTVDQFTLGLRVRHCDGAPMVRTKSLPPEPPIEDLEAAQDAAHRTSVREDPEITGYRSSRRRR